MGVELVVDSIEALIDRARAPDASLAMRQATFTLIVERYQDAAYGYALALYGAKNVTEIRVLSVD